MTFENLPAYHALVQILEVAGNAKGLQYLKMLNDEVNEEITKDSTNVNTAGSTDSSTESQGDQITVFALRNGIKDNLCGDPISSLQGEPIFWIPRCDFQIELIITDKKEKGPALLKKESKIVDPERSLCKDYRNKSMFNLNIQSINNLLAENKIQKYNHHYYIVMVDIHFDSLNAAVTLARGCATNVQEELRNKTGQSPRIVCSLKTIDYKSFYQIQREKNKEKR